MVFSACQTNNLMDSEQEETNHGQIGQTRIGSVAPHFNLFISTATSSAKCEYVAVPQDFSLKEEKLVEMRNKIGTTPAPLQKRT